MITLIPLMVAAHVVLSIVVNVSFKRSAMVKGALRFLLWQALGNLCGFMEVLLFTYMLRFLPISVLFPITQGLGVLAVQLVGASILMKERISPLQWAGTGLILGGILLVSLG